jgi:hypothetical protein
MKFGSSLATGLACLVLAACERRPVVAEADPLPREYAAVAQKAAQAAYTRLSAELAAAIAEGGAVQAIDVCSQRAIAITREISMDQGMEMQRLSHRPRNPLNAAAGRDLEVIEAYQSQIAESKPLSPEVDGPSGGTAVVRLPILLSQPLCLTCHGAPGSDIEGPTLEAIRIRYPDDKATGFSHGELRGIWRVELSAEHSP